MKNLIAGCFVMLIVTSVVRGDHSPDQLGGDPWNDASYPGTKQEEIRILQQYHDATLDQLAASTEESYSEGSSLDLALVRYHYFQAAARLAWSKGKFDESYRATEFAQISAEGAVARLLISKRRQRTALENYLIALQNRAEIGIVFLRYKEEAKRRNVEMEPATREMMNEQLDEVLEERIGSDEWERLNKIFEERQQRMRERREGFERRRATESMPRDRGGAAESRRQPETIIESDSDLRGC